MSKQQSFNVSDLDCRIVKRLSETMRSRRDAVDARAAEYVESQQDYNQYIDRMAREAGMESAEGYRVNFATKQLEPIPPPAEKKPAPAPVQAPDALEAPAPFREADAETK